MTLPPFETRPATAQDLCLSCFVQPQVGTTVTLNVTPFTDYCCEGCTALFLKRSDRVEAGKVTSAAHGKDRAKKRERAGPPPLQE